MILTPTKIVVYSLGMAFVYTKLIMPEIRNYIIKSVRERRLRQWKQGKRQDLGDINELSAIIRTPIKPLDCIKCLAFWFSIILSIFFGHKEESGLISILSLACGMLLEGIIMRYL